MIRNAARLTSQQRLCIVYRGLKNIPGLPWRLEQSGNTVAILIKAPLGANDDGRRSYAKYPLPAVMRLFTFLCVTRSLKCLDVLLWF